jgi:hypothetical protein
VSSGDATDAARCGSRAEGACGAVQYRDRVYWAMAQLRVPAEEICTEGSKGGEVALRLGI